MDSCIKGLDDLLNPCSAYDAILIITGHDVLAALVAHRPMAAGYTYCVNIRHQANLAQISIVVGHAGVYTIELLMCWYAGWWLRKHGVCLSWWLFRVEWLTSHWSLRIISLWLLHSSRIHIRVIIAELDWLLLLRPGLCIQWISVTWLVYTVCQ